MKHFSALAALLFFFAWTHLLWADPGNAPDVVVMQDGSLYRGTISEKTTAEVEIVLLSGKIRTLSMEDVEYAGPANDAPNSKSEAETNEDAPHRHIVTVRGQEARLKLEGNPPGLTYHRRAGSASAVAVGAGGTAVARSVGYEEMCTSPCEVTMPAGTHTLALSEPGGSPVESGPVTIPAGSSTLRGNYDSKSGIRIAGTIIAITGVVVGSAIMLSSIGGDSEGSTSSIYLGGGIMLGGILIGMPMMYVSDGVDIQVAGSSPPQRSISRGVSFAGAF